MSEKIFPVIDPVATGENILRLRKERSLTVRDLQGYFGFEEPQAIYKWQRGKSLPSVDNLYALGALFEIPMEQILVPLKSQKFPITQKRKRQESKPAACAIHGAYAPFHRLQYSHVETSGYTPCHREPCPWISARLHA